MAAPGLPENAYRARAERGEIQIGTWITMIRTPSVLALLQAAGLDYARLDTEHSAFSIETVADMAALARALDFPLVVRPPEGNREWITRLLDAGVWNLHVPQVETAEQAAAIVAATTAAACSPDSTWGMCRFHTPASSSRVIHSRLPSGGRTTNGKSNARARVAMSATVSIENAECSRSRRA